MTMLRNVGRVNIGARVHHGRLFARFEKGILGMVLRELSKIIKPSRKCLDDRQVLALLGLPSALSRALRSFLRVDDHMSPLVQLLDQIIWLVVIFLEAMKRVDVGEARRRFPFRALGD